MDKLFGLSIALKNIVLPLGISFFTFTQIAFLVDTYRKKVKSYDILEYFLFVTFFPHLIAGPILNHQQIIPQFKNINIIKFNSENVSVGMTIFFAGLFKKVILADGVSQFVNPVFNAAAAGTILNIWQAWGGALAYSLQLYFDFSGYSDMAIGLAFLFNITIPMNFFSPYKANNIIEFWRRWHMTLSWFLRDYLYIPLGGNRNGDIRKQFNLFITMVLGGLWHGAGWTFVLWGALHGLYLVINHSWIAFRKKYGINMFLPDIIGKGLTFICVVIGWVLFRAENLHTASYILSGMFGLNNFMKPKTASNMNIDYLYMYSFIIALLCIVWLAPNIYQIMGGHNPGYDIYGHLNRDSIGIKDKRFIWKPNFAWAMLIATLAIISIINLSQRSEFLYFRF